VKRFLIFLLLFPAIATGSFFAVIYILTGAELDSLSGPAIGFLIFCRARLAGAGRFEPRDNELEISSSRLSKRSDRIPFR
jgi:hypothetical protein